MTRLLSHGTDRHNAFRSALLASMDIDIAALRANLDYLARQVETRRGAGLDVTADETRLGELIATVGRMSSELAQMVAEVGA